MTHIQLPWKDLFTITFWQIWSTINKLVMEKQPFDSRVTINKIQDLFLEIKFTAQEDQHP
jgi:hypothetical protein